MPGDRAEERPGRGLVTRAVRGEELHLDRVHRVDVGVAEPDRALEDGVAVEQVAGLDDGEHRLDRPRVLVLDQCPTAGRASGLSGTSRR